MASVTAKVVDVGYGEDIMGKDPKATIAVTSTR